MKHGNLTRPREIPDSSRKILNPSYEIPDASREILRPSRKVCAPPAKS